MVLMLVSQPCKSYRGQQRHVLRFNSRLQTGQFSPSLRQSSQLQQRTVVAQGLFGLGVPEIAVIGVVAALVFGPSKLPELGKLAGKSVKSIQSAASEFEKELKEEVNKPEEGAEATATPASDEKKDSQKQPETQKPDPQKSETQKPDPQKSEPQKSDGQNPESQKPA